eukprot:jgi/Chrzof1/15169/Cz09g30050.t1
MKLLLLLCLVSCTTATRFTIFGGRHLMQASNASVNLLPAIDTSAVNGSAGLLAEPLLPLLLAIQDARIYNDSKTAVDLVLNQSVADTAAAYNSELANNATPQAVQAFVNAYLAPAGSDLVECVPTDWVELPPDFLPNLNESSNAPNASSLRDFGLRVHALWNLLCKTQVEDVHDNPERHSLLSLPEQFIVPGDRFRETYYWDSYWVIRGLIVSKMVPSAKFLVQNLLYMLNEIGFVPNGARVYYLNRSQPPLLSGMVRSVVEAGNDTELMAAALPLLIREHHYWTTGDKLVMVQAANGTVYNMSRYYANWTSPRPESYREDVATAIELTGDASPSNPATAALYRELASGAETGWDYSSRWFANGMNLSTIRTTSIVPADLNAFLYQIERNIAWGANLTGNASLSDEYNKLAMMRYEAINALLWNETTGAWHDGVLNDCSNITDSTAVTGDATADSTATAGTASSGANATASMTMPSSSQPPAGGMVYCITQNPGVFASNYIPLWAGLTEMNPDMGAAAVTSLNNSGLIQPGGIATTLYNTGQQWDFPNGWPPLQHMIVEGLAWYGGPEGVDLARSLAARWIRSNEAVFNQTGHMIEKYDVRYEEGALGGGGEYALQVGFGWSNGVALDFLDKYFY